jgi:dUTP pyrophosphatase
MGFLVLVALYTIARDLIDFSEPVQRTVPVKWTRLHAQAKCPTYAHPGDSGADVYALESVLIGPGEWRLLKTGVAYELPPGYEFQVRPRSGMSAKGVWAGFGTVDEPYRGEVKILLINHSNEDSYEVKAGDRIAQLVLAPVTRARFEYAVELGESERGTSGFGGSGR